MATVHTEEGFASIADKLEVRVQNIIGDVITHVIRDDAFIIAVIFIIVFVNEITTMTTIVKEDFRGKMRF